MRNRPNIDETMMSIAMIISQRSECQLRNVGAVIVDNHNNILSTGTNGNAPGAKWCMFEECRRKKESGGDRYDLCYSSHSEISALVRLRDPWNAARIYVTTEPCIECTKAIMLTSISSVIYMTNHPKSGVELWERRFGSLHNWTKFNGDLICAREAYNERQ